MHDVSNAKYLEKLISNQDLRSFVFESRDDMKLFFDEVTISTFFIHLSSIFFFKIYDFFKGPRQTEFKS